MTDLFAPLSFTHGPAMKNRLMLAPLTNKQSHPDGSLSDEEILWLSMRAQGGFGLVTTAAAYVQTQGKGFEGQLGIHADYCLDGLTRMAAAIRAEGAIAHVQLHHAGLRSETSFTGMDVVAPSDDAKSGARAMTIGEIEAMIEAFIAAAERADKAGFDGVALHGAHTYLLCEFLSPDYNRRDDRYGGSLDNRARPIREIIAGIRARCRPDFGLGLRLSPERMGVRTADILTLCQQLFDEDQLDYLDLSMWDVFKQAEEEAFQSKPLLAWFTGLNRRNTRLGIAGAVRSGAAARACLEAGADFAIIGRAAITNHDFADRVRATPDFEMPALPVAPAALSGQGISPAFMTYLGTFNGFLTAA